MNRKEEENQHSGTGGYLEPHVWLPYLETVIAFGVIVLVNLFWFRSDWGFLDTKPHPFWILVIAVPVMYGLFPGLFAGIIALVAHTAFQVTETPVHLDLTVPALMLVCAVAAGEVRQRSLTRIRELTDLNLWLEAAMEDLSSRFTQSEKARALLHHRILGQTMTFANLYQVAKRLDTLDEAEIPPAAAEVTAKLLKAEIVSVCSYQNGKLKVLEIYPPNAASGVSNKSLTTSPVLKRCLEQGKTVSLHDVVPNLASDQLIPTPIAIAAPLLGRDSTVTGFILVEKIGFSHFTSTSVTTAAEIAQWTSHSLQTAELFRETREHNNGDDMAGMYRISPKRLGEEIARANTYGFPMSVAVLEIERSQEITKGMMSKVLSRVGEACRRELGPADLLGRHPDGVSFMIFYPHRDHAEADEVVAALVQKLEALGIRPFADEQPLRLTYRVREVCNQNQASQASQAREDITKNVEEFVGVGT